MYVMCMALFMTLQIIGWKEEIAAMDIDKLRSHEKVHVARELTEGGV